MKYDITQIDILHYKNLYLHTVNKPLTLTLKFYNVHGKLAIQNLLLKTGRTLLGCALLDIQYRDSYIPC